MPSATKKGRDGAVKEQSLYMLCKLNWYKFKLGCDNFTMLNITPMVTKKKIAIKYIQKEMIGELKPLNIKKSTKHKRKQ